MTNSPVLEMVEKLPSGTIERPPILFVHGAAHGAWCWRNWMGAAAEAGYPSHAVSLRGHSGSEGSLFRSTLSSYVEDVINTADSLPEKPVLIGHSLGGLVVQIVIAEYEATAAVLVAPVAARSGYRTLFSIARQRPADALKILAGGSTPMRYEYLFEGLNQAEATSYINQCGPESTLAQFQVIFHKPSKPPRGGAPVLVLGTPEDNLIPLPDLHDTASRYSAPLLEFPGMGHDLMLDEGWREPADEMIGWLNRVC
ncbi:MAG: alpha/beta hydrolase [Solirubrobacterales bacterium]